MEKIERLYKFEKITESYRSRKYTIEQLSKRLAVPYRELQRLLQDENFHHTIDRSGGKIDWNPVIFPANYNWLDTIDMAVIDSL